MIIMNYLKHIVHRSKKQTAVIYDELHQDRTTDTAHDRDNAAFSHTSNLPHLSEILFDINRFV